MYFAVIQMDFFWYSELYLIEEKDGEIIGLHATGAGGLGTLFEYEIVEISQGIFIAAYCSTHMGNGNLELIPLDELGKAKYSIPAAGYYAALKSERNALESNLILGYSSDFYQTHVFIDGKLHAEYTDVDDNGTTDIILKGILQVYNTDEGSGKELQDEYYFCQVYVYDEGEDAFLYSGELSEVLEIK